MNRSTRPFLVLLCFGVLAACLTASAPQETASSLPPLVLPTGFHAEVFAETVENARSMALGPQGTVFVGSQYVGKVRRAAGLPRRHQQLPVVAGAPNVPARC
jgi:glucose/arabinose dehydrogenase